VVDDVLADDPAWRWNRLVTRWVAEEGSRRAVDAFDEVAPEVLPLLSAALEAGPPVVDHPDLETPAYWAANEFHLTEGGWDGHPQMGFILDELVFRKIIAYAGVGAVAAGENIISQRDLVAQATRLASPGVIFEPGCGSGRYLSCLQRTWPEARIIGCDLSVTQLQAASAKAADMEASWELHRAPAEHTGLPDESVDLVSTYTLLHEVPLPAAGAITAEAWRILKPGGELVHADVPPYTRLDAFRAVVNDWENDHREEPFWRAASMADRGRMLREAGFVDVEEVTPAGVPYPWVTRGRKPGAVR
jgi:SAM-dependent methyltransferase